MVFKLVEAEQRAWRRLDGGNQLRKVILGVKFTDGLEVTSKPRDHPPVRNRAAWPSGRHQE
jgi:hypothetical protein